MCVLVFPAGGSGSVAFRGLNTGAVFCLCVLGKGKWVQGVKGGGRFLICSEAFCFPPLFIDFKVEG